jgi:hypothetical protein
MDTIDTAEYLEGVYPDKYPGIRDAMVELVREIHEAFPDFKLISNNGFTVLERIAPYLSGMLSEDIHMMVDFENDSYQPVPEEDYDYKVEMLQRLMKRYDLPVFNIDYVSQKNHRLRKKLIRKSQRLGFKPYVAETNLSEIYEQ